MPKGYIDFDTFRAQHPHKPRLPLCPRCKKPMEFVTKNVFGKVMCADCLAAEEGKRSAYLKRKEEREAKIQKELEDEEALKEIITN